MNVTFMQFSKRVNSTKTPTAEELAAGVKLENVVLKESTNIDNPTLIIDGTSQNLYAYNYIYIHEWGRYYFIDTCDLRHNSIFTVKCTLDALATFKTQIQAYTAFVERCADPTYYNIHIPDHALSVHDEISHVDSASTYCSIATGLMYIVRVLGRSSTGGIGTFVMNAFTLQNIFSQLWGDLDDGTTVGDIPELLQVAISNPSQYIIGVYSSPIGASVYGSHCSNVELYMGGHKTGVNLDKITSGDAILQQGLTLNKPTSIYSDFRKTDAAFSQYCIYIPTIGVMNLSADLMDSVLTMDVGADLMSGDLLFTLKADGDVVASYQSNCYATMSLGGVNQAGSIFAGAMQSAVGLMSGNVGATIEGIKTAMSPTPTVVGSQGGTGCVSLANEIVITCMQKSSADFPTEVNGRPCCKNLLLSNLSGFVKCGGSSLALPSNKAVIDSVNSLLDSGFYME